VIVGSDISQFQGSINWDTYKNNSNFVIIRSTYGNGYYDSWFAHNRDEARRVGLPHGFYHFCYPQYNSPLDEAKWFCKALYDLQEGESLYLDWEETYSGDAVAWCKTFLDYVSANFNGIKPLIYLNQSYMSLDWSPVVNAGYGLWLASYQADGMGNTGKWPSMALQQTYSSQQVPGIVGNVDRDVFFGDIDQFKAYGYKKPVIVVNIPEPVVVPEPTQAPGEEPVNVVETPPTVTTEPPAPIPTVTSNTNSEPLPTVTSSTNPLPKVTLWQQIVNFFTNLWQTLTSK
jgi:GH25 family lysozyme M1 (1,4-beta-N-acetylmuramidase)